MEANKKNLNAVKAHLVKRLEVKVLARFGGKRTGEVVVPHRSDASAAHSIVPTVLFVSVCCADDAAVLATGVPDV